VVDRVFAADFERWYWLGSWSSPATSMTRALTQRPGARDGDDGRRS
jgi:hypothetical protein